MTQYRDIIKLFEDEQTQERLDRAIIEIMDIVRDETQMDTDSDDDDRLWGVVYGYVYGALGEAYSTRLSLIEDRTSRGVE